MITQRVIESKKHAELIEITRDVQQILYSSKVEEGYVHVYTPHTTAGIMINENADPDVCRDVLNRLDRLYPWDHPEDRHAEGNTAAHLKAITTGTSQTIIIQQSRLMLGRWQGIFFCEFDGPRRRQYVVQVVSTK